jgi:D-3-phosphoglycerate dehydrogenase / 2-oxoglutarate reductase
MSFFIAVTDSPADQADLSVERSVLHDMRVEKVNWHDEASRSRALREAHAILCMHARIDRACIGAMRQCRVIVRYGTGLDNIDREAAAGAGINVIGIHDYCTDEVADHTLALLLAWNRKIIEYRDFVTQKHWNERPQTTGNWGCGELHGMSGQTLGVLGFGHIGRAVARRATAFGMRVCAYSRHIDPDVAREHGASPATRDALLAESDYVSLHLPLTSESRHVINRDALASMKPGAVLINTSRGGLVDETALIEALRSGRLAGALLDVYDRAPLPIEHPLREFRNVILTPHVAFYSEESLRKLRLLAAQAVLRSLRQGGD